MLVDPVATRGTVFWHPFWASKLKLLDHKGQLFDYRAQLPDHKIQLPDHRARLPDHMVDRSTTIGANG